MATTSLTQVLEAMSDAAFNLCTSDESNTNTQNDEHLQKLIKHAIQLKTLGTNKQQITLFDTFSAATQEYLNDLKKGITDKEKCMKVLKTFAELAESYDT
jgi:hypothetical protein